MPNRESQREAGKPLMPRGAKPSKARLLVVEDHLIVREGFVALLNREPDLEVCAEADGATAALLAVEQAQPDLVIVDLTLREGDGMQLLKELRSRHPKLPSLVISMQHEEHFAERTLRAGARGYVMKECASEEVLDAIRAVLRGEVYVSRAMGARMLSKFVEGRPPAGGDAADLLTDRELRIFQMIGAGMGTRDIAQHLSISIKTVETHRDNIKHKLGLRDGMAVVQQASLWIQRKRTPETES